MRPNRRPSRRFAATAALALSVPIARAQPVPAYKDPKAPLERRVDDLLSRLTRDEKISLMCGTEFTTQPIPRLGVPPMAMVDAGQGVRGGMASTKGPATLFPSGIAMASTWDPALIGRVARAIGMEARNKGTGAQVLLGPAVNIHRTPLGGRNGEYFSEDPYLAARLAVGYVKGMQSAGVAACLKHYAANNQETDRMSVDAQITERALREIYLPAFEAGIKEGRAWTVMSAYNKVNGLHASAQPYLLTDVLKKGWRWDGMVMSDWGGVHETAAVINAGNDLEMPGPGWLSPEKATPAIEAGQVTMATVDANVRRILRTIVRVGLLDGLPAPDNRVVDSPAHRQLTYEAAANAIVLLKNEGNVLPLERGRMKSVAVIGRGATELQLGADGSPQVDPAYSVQPLDGIQRRAGQAITVRHAHGINTGQPIAGAAIATPEGDAAGLRAEYFANARLEGQPALVRTDPSIQFHWRNHGPAPGLPADGFSVRWTGRLTPSVSGRYTITLTTDDGCRLFLDGKALIDRWIPTGPEPQVVKVDLEAGRTYDLRLEYFEEAGGAMAVLNWTLPNTEPFAEAVEAASASDAAIVYVTTKGTEGEGHDRPSMALPDDQDNLIRAVAAVNKKTVVVLNNGTPVLMTGWLSRVPAVVEAWFPGETGGDALAAVLFGDVNPSGKLPDTLAAKREDYPDWGNYPGANNTVRYDEGIYVGYRHFDKRRIAPLFPFGHGLSYTTFRYADLKLSKPSLSPTGAVTATVRVTNTGRRAGAEVVQLYVHDPRPKVDKPVRELKGFQKVRLAPGESKTVTLTFTPRALAYCDVPGRRWKADAGAYEVQVGSSSRDIRQKATVRLTSDYTEPIPFMDPRAGSRQRP